MGHKTDIWMPLYIGDYLADTSMLDAEQSGCYLHWLMCYWRTGPLDDDIPSLILIGKLKNLPSATSTAQALLKRFFEQSEDGKWHQKRMDAEMVQWRDKKQKAKEKASKGGIALKKLRDASSTPQAVLNECPSPSPLPIKKRTIPQEVKEEIYQAYPKHEGKLDALRAIEKAVLSNGHDADWYLERVRAYALQVQGSDPKFIPYPATWFNKGNYLNDNLSPKPKVEWIDLETGKAL